MARPSHSFTESRILTSRIVLRIRAYIYKKSKWSHSVLMISTINFPDFLDPLRKSLFSSLHGVGDSCPLLCPGELGLRQSQGQ